MRRSLTRGQPNLELCADPQEGGTIARAVALTFELIASKVVGEAQLEPPPTGGDAEIEFPDEASPDSDTKKPREPGRGASEIE